MSFRLFRVYWQGGLLVVSYKGKNMQYQKGSFTVEASIYVPLVLFMVIGTMQLGIDQYTKSKEQVVPERIEKLSVVSEFYIYQTIDKVREELGDD